MWKDWGDKVLGITMLAIVFFYIFKDTQGTTSLLNGFSNLYTGGIKALQGR